MVKNDLSSGKKVNADEVRPLIIAHRGSSAVAPENTLAAFQQAIDDGADGIEFDVRLAKDSVAVVFHDATLNRTGGMDGKISNFTSRDLSKLDVGSWFNKAFPRASPENFSSQRVPTLKKTLEILRRFKGRIYIELKCSDAEVEPLANAVCKEITASGLSERVIVKSFRLTVIPHVRRSCPNVRTAALFAPKIMNILRKEKHLVLLAAEFGADELSLHFSLATRKLMKKAERAGLPVTVWTADSPRWVKRGLKLGLHAIITNNPNKLLKKRDDVLGVK